ncbi:MAG: hypothetical protein RDU20_04675 [Desulfomonilaceae bacterium]|nr:hypothetical protein [Desulfomonilaceae bacterium]
MPELDIDKPRRRTKTYGVLLASLVAAGSLILVAMTQEPKSAVSSPGPAKAAIVPQIADAKSEAEIMFRGKSFSVMQRNVAFPFSGVVTDIHVRGGDTVDKDAKLVTYTLDRESMMHVQRVLYPETVLRLKNAVEEQETALMKLRDVSLPVKELELERIQKEYDDLRNLESKRMAAAEAVSNKLRQLKAVKKDLLSIRESIKQTEGTVVKTKKDLAFYEEKQRLDLDLLEWQTKRSYSKDTQLPLDVAYLTAPIAGKVIWLNLELRVDAEPARGFRAVLIAPINPMVVRCKVHELDLVKLKIGDKGTVTFDALPESMYTCKISRIPWVSRNPSLEVPADYEIECRLDDADGKIKDGLTCNVKVSVRQ